MKTITKEALLKALYRSVPYVVMALVMVGNILPVFADGDTIFSVYNETNQKVIEEFVEFFDFTLLPISILGFFGALFFTGKNEKTLPFFKTAAKVMAIATLGVNGIKPVTNTLIHISNILNGAGG